MKIRGIGLSKLPLKYCSSIQENTITKRMQQGAVLIPYYVVAFPAISIT